MEECVHQRPVTGGPDGGAVTNTALENLPEHLILHILSFLPTLDTVATSLVSKRFSSFWSIVPSLNFSFSSFPSYNTPMFTRRSFAEFVDRTLICRSSSPVRKFCLDFPFEDRYSFHVSSWIAYAIKNHVEEIDLDFFLDGRYLREEPNLQDPYYDFYFSVLRNGRVKALKLTRCNVILPLNMASMRFWAMKSVILDQVYLSDEMLLDLVSGCPNLEVFELHNCYGMDTVKVCSGKLKELALSFFYPNDENDLDLVIDCPSLVSLSVSWFAMKKCRVHDLSSLVRFHSYIGHRRDMFYTYWMRTISILDQIPHIQSLVVQNWWLKLQPKQVFSQGFQLYNLKQLELQTDYTRYDLLGMVELLELTPHLESLILNLLPKVDKEDESMTEEQLTKPIILNIPRLKEVKLNHFTCTKSETEFLALLKVQGVALEKIVIVPVGEGFVRCAPITLYKRSRKIEGAKEVEAKPAC